MCLAVSDSLRGRSFHAMLKYEGPASLVTLFFTHSSLPCLLHSFRPYIRDMPGRARNMLHLGAFNVLQDWLRTNPTNFLNTDSLVCVFSRTCVVTFKQMHHLTSPCLLLSLLLSFLCQAGYVNGNPSGPQLGDRSKKPTWRSGFSQATTLPTNKELRISLCSYTALATQITYVMIILQHPDHRDSSILFLGNPTRPQEKAYLWERSKAPLPPL